MVICQSEIDRACIPPPGNRLSPFRSFPHSQTLSDFGVKEKGLFGLLQPEIPVPPTRMLLWLRSIAVECNDALDLASIKGNGTLVIHFQNSSLRSVGGPLSAE